MDSHTCWIDPICVSSARIGTRKAAPLWERSWCRPSVMLRHGDDSIGEKLGNKRAETERLAYSIRESADLLGVNYFSVYRLIQRGNLRACRALSGKLLVPRSELLRLLKT